jgi:hypothetical protein
LLSQKKEILQSQQEELIKPTYDPSKVYEIGEKFNESDLTEHN